MFFSVKTPTKIAGKVYTPCICYPLPDVLKPTIEKMVKDEKAYIYDTKVFFQNGKVIEKKVVESKPANTKKTKKAKKGKKVEAPLETKEEDVPSPEEIAEGF